MYWLFHAIVLSTLTLLDTNIEMTEIGEKVTLMHLPLATKYHLASTQLRGYYVVCVLV